MGKQSLAHVWLEELTQVKEQENIRVSCMSGSHTNEKESNTAP